MPTHDHGADNYEALSTTCEDKNYCTLSYYYNGAPPPYHSRIGLINRQGSNASHNNMPPYYVLTACQKIYNPKETIGIRTENPNSQNALDVNGSVSINGRMNVNKTMNVKGNITANILCSLKNNKTQCKSVADL